MHHECSHKEPTTQSPRFGSNIHAARETCFRYSQSVEVLLAMFDADRVDGRWGQITGKSTESCVNGGQPPVTVSNTYSRGILDLEYVVRV